MINKSFKIYADERYDVSNVFPIKLVKFSTKVYIWYTRRLIRSFWTCVTACTVHMKLKIALNEKKKSQKLKLIPLAEINSNERM